MKLPSIKRIVAEEIGTKDSAIMKMIATINTFFEAAYNALNKGITITDNLDGEIKEISLNGTYPYRLKWDRKTPPRVAWIAYSDTTPTAGVFLHWSYSSNGLFTIESVEGIAPTDASPVTVRIIILCG